jgi:molybdate transport system substrate-binding protein
MTTYYRLFSLISAYFRLIALNAKKSLRIHPAVSGICRILTLVLLFSLAQRAVNAAELNVFAAASLTDALKEIGANYEKQSPDKVFFNFGASSLLARQIAEAAPVDVFFSADEAKMDQLDKKDLVLKGTRRSRLSNSLVIVTAADSEIKINSPADLADAKIKRIALADPKAVPAGVYSKAWLEKQKLWTKVEPKIVPTDNVRAALAAVESGNIEAGMVFKTDAAISKKVKIAYESPVKDTPNISYPMAVMKNSKSIESAKKFVEYLDSNDAAKVFEKYGFIVLK